MTTPHSPPTLGGEAPPEGGVVYKICPRGAWIEAQRTGELFPSPDDVRDGFIHLSAKAQVRGTLARHFAGEDDLVLLSVAVARLPDGVLVWEKSRSGQSFPHLYGALSATTVLDVTQIPTNGVSFDLPEGF